MTSVHVSMILFRLRFLCLLDFWGSFGIMVKVSELSSVKLNGSSSIHFFFFKSSAGCCFYIHNWNKFPPHHHHPIDTAWADLCCTAIKSINDLYLSLFWISVISPTVFSTFVYSYTVWVNKCFRVINVMFSCLPFFKLNYTMFSVYLSTRYNKQEKKGYFVGLT